MRRRRQRLKYLTLLRLWWLGLRRPTRLALSGTLAVLVLGTTMPLMAAATSGTEEDGEAILASAVSTDSTESAPVGETEMTPVVNEGDDGTELADLEEGSEQPADESSGDDGVTPEDDMRDESGVPEAGDDNVRTEDTDQGDVQVDDADAEPAQELEPDDQSQVETDEQASDEVSPGDETVPELPVGEAGESAETAPASEPVETAPASDTPLGEQTAASPGESPDESDVGALPVVETPAVLVEEPAPLLDAEIASDEAAISASGDAQLAPDPAPIVVDTRTAQKQAARRETNRRKAEVVDVGVRLLTSLLLTYEVDADLPAPARTPRISHSFAEQLTAAADRHGADWALVLGAVRALDYRGVDPADADLLDLLAKKLAGLDRTTSVANLRTHLTLVESDAVQATALARYYRAAGVDGVVKGLDGARNSLEQRVLAHPEIRLPGEGRRDIESGRIGVRVLVTLLYLAERHDDVVVSSLKTGHRIFARPGVVSAHVYGQAVDIAALDGLSILGNQGPGSVTEIAVRDLISLPADAYPRQVISLHAMGGPSLAEPREHHNHIHIGF